VIATSTVKNLPSCRIAVHLIITPPAIKRNPRPAQKGLRGLERKNPPVNPKDIISQKKMSDPLSLLVLVVPPLDRLIRLRRNSEKAYTKER
jgi:hypothetical protein